MNMPHESKEEFDEPADVRRAPSFTSGVSTEAELAGDDEKNYVVLNTADLQPLPSTEDRISEALQESIQNLKYQEDWLEQHEAIVVLRRVIVHHSVLVEKDDIDAFVDRLTIACDNLRSVLAKNALLAFAECFQFLGKTQLEPFLFRRKSSMLDVLLRRAVCEKRFLRDAATYAVSHLTRYLASIPLLTCCSEYAVNKNARVCGTAAKVINGSLIQMTTSPASIVALAQQLRSPTNETAIQHLLSALAALRSSKDSTARAEAIMSLKLLAQVMGEESFVEKLRKALADQHTASKILIEVRPQVAGSTSAVGPDKRRGSLRDRMLGSGAGS